MHINKTKKMSRIPTKSYGWMHVHIMVPAQHIMQTQRGNSQCFKSNLLAKSENPERKHQFPGLLGVDTGLET
jgi:NADH:ubiquinone oxidoreductase subunit